ncbi:anti-sigma factor [Spirosoma sp. BT702]|uniref:Anti-sigma factor n=2 Tax=Spirosoma profusum TaxID=2771354 RepID=A0A926XYF7_9BACT|nr:anti-sigma factor [Spirosoma profusum]
MDELDKNIPDDLWRKVFNEASETPPPRVWDAIERRLDESSGPKILPLWGSGLASSRSLQWGMRVAAAVTLLLVGWWAFTTLSVDKPEQRISQAHKQSKTNVADDVANPGNVANSDRVADSGNVAFTEANKPATKILRSYKAKHGSTSEQNTSDLIASNAKPQRNAVVSAPATSVVSRKKLAATFTRPGQIQNDPTFVSFPDATFPSVATDYKVPATSASPGAEAITNVTSDQNNYSVASYSQLRNKPLRIGGARPIQRIVWFRPAEAPLEADVASRKRERKEMWASVGMMSGTYNPMVSVHSAPVLALANNSFQNTPTTTLQAVQPSVNSRANFSVAYQAGAGVQVTEHWSFESGVGYLAGRSTVETPIQSAGSVSGLVNSSNAPGNISSNLFLDALRSTSSSSTGYASVTADKMTGASINYANQAVYNERNQQVLTNNYQYVQVPVQVGYQLRPRKRLGLALVGGFLTNIFVRNTVGNDVVVTAKDGVYRPVSLAATMGARFRYRPSRQWSASLAGVYQPSIGTSTSAQSQIQSHPTVMGMSFGVDYHF